MTTLPDDLEQALTALCARRGVDRDTAVRSILQEWMRTHGFLDGDVESEEAAAEPRKPDPDFVQYPGYFEGRGSL
ncbi:hypothetical protein ACLE20_07705 [Rhizobium sp. YIM 134829]|uniref:hypothetical protein n=1 Tax=Rhizobium sp. YIM 134829 TaxID=3390453 RepID=UPI003979D616